MKICIIIDDYMPNSIKVGAKMMHELACEFQRQGHVVTVVTPSSRLKVKTNISVLDGVTVCRFKSGEVKNVGKVKRVINETLLSYRAWKSFKVYFKDNPHDLIVYYSPSIFWGNLVLKLKKLWAVKSYLILRDLFPQWAIDQQLIKENSLIEKYFRLFEQINYNASDMIGLMSMRNLEWFIDNFSLEKELRVLHNWASIVSVESKNIYRKKFNLENKIVYFYGGNMGHAQDMMNIIRLVIRMKSTKEAHFVFVGAGDEFDLINNVVERQELQNITILQSVSQEVYKEMLAEFDIGLFSLHKDHITHNFPGKLLGYMLQCMPVLGSINPNNDLKDIIEAEEAGLISINGEDTVFFENAIKLLDSKLRHKIGNNGKKLLLEKFSVENIAVSILTE